MSIFSNYVFTSIKLIQWQILTAYILVIANNFSFLPFKISIILSPNFWDCGENYMDDMSKGYLVRVCDLPFYLNKDCSQGKPGLTRKSWPIRPIFHFPRSVTLQLAFEAIIRGYARKLNKNPSECDGILDAISQQNGLLQRWS